MADISGFAKRTAFVISIIWRSIPILAARPIQFGSNLIEHTKGWDMTEFATVIVPLGNRLDKSPIEALDAYLTVESVNEGSLYVQSSEAVKTYGWIEKTVTWDSVSDPEALLEKAKAYPCRLAVRQHGTGSECP